MKLDRMTKSIAHACHGEVSKTFSNKIPKVKELLLEGYDSLDSYITNDYAKARPANFRAVFEESIEDFDYIEYSGNKIFFVVPTVDTFNFEGQELLLQIVEGTIGEYVEIGHDDLIKLNIIPNTVPINPYDPVSEQRFILEYTDTIISQEMQILGKRLIKFPFSNTPPLNDVVFGKADEYVKDNIGNWINEALKKNVSSISQKYRRI